MCSGCQSISIIPQPDFTGLYDTPDYMPKLDEDDYRSFFLGVYVPAVQWGLLPAGARILDFGSGRGYWHKFLNEQGHSNVVSYDVNKHMVAFAQQSLGVHPVVSNLAGQEPFDIVFMNHVFEHVPDPYIMLADEVAPVLAPTGSIVIALPNANSLNRRLLGRRWLGYAPTEHIHLPSVAGLSSRLSDVGFKLARYTISSAVGKAFDQFRPRGRAKRAYYRTVMPVAERMGRGDQLIVVLERRIEATVDRA